MRRLLAIFFILVFSIQALPLKAIGKMLMKGQTTEEVKEDCCDDDDGPDEGDAKYTGFLHPNQDTPCLGILPQGAMGIVAHTEDDLPTEHIKDIHCPPTE